MNLNADADGTGDLNPERVQIQFDDDLIPEEQQIAITQGDNLGDVTGVVDFAFGNFEVLATEAVVIDQPSTNVAETTALTNSDNELTFATYNVLNLTSTQAVEEGVTDPDAAQRTALANQIVNNLGSPDILALQEIQDNDGVEGGDNTVGFTDATQTLQDLVDAIAAAGGPTYSFAFAEGEVGTQGGIPSGNIRNAFLYNEERVTANEITTLEVTELTDLGVTNPDTFTGTRDPLLGVFEFNGQEVTIINNHFSSRFGSDPIFGGPQPFEQGGEAAREAEAAAINEVVDALLAETPGRNIIVAGDLNTFEFTNDLTEILPGVGEEQVLTNLITDALEGDEASTFNFQGNSQVLDHIFTTDGLLNVAEVDIVHVNNEFPDFASDHEPVVARFNLPTQPTPGDDILIGTDGDDTFLGSLGDDLIDGGSGIDTIDFSNAEQGVNINLRTGDATQLTNEAGFLTDEGSQVDGNNGFTVTPILTIGETLSTSGALNPNLTAISDDGEILDPLGEFTPVGILDGLGATRIELADGTEVVRVFANHELNGGQGNNFELSDGQGGTFTLDGSRISFFDIDIETKAIVDSGLAFNQIIQPDGEIAQNLDFLPSPSTPFFGGSSTPQTGIDRFCSGNLEEGNSFGNAEDGFRGTVDDIYFAGEEDGGGFNSVGGTQFALDFSNDSGDGGVLYTLPFFGRGSFENSTQLDTGEGDHVAFIQTDDQSPFDFDGDGVNETAAVYLYIGRKSDDADADFLERNGLTDGKLFVFVPDDPSLDSPLEFNGAGANQPGRWVQVDNRPLDPDAVNADSGSFDPENLPEGGPQEGFPFTLAPSEDGSTGFDEFGFPTQGNLLTQAEALGSFGFSRPEDVATNPTQPNQVVIASTGVDTFDVDPETGNGADTFGTIYTLDVDFAGVDFDALFAGEEVEIGAELAILYDGDEDPTRAIRSPDNLDFTEDGRIIIQEDEAEEDTLSGDELLFGPPSDDPDGPILANPLEAGILILDPSAGPEALSQGEGITRVATVDRNGVIDPSVIAPTTAFDEDLVGVPNVSFNGIPDGGEAETSGVIDVSSLFDEAPGTLFLADTQFHGIEDQDALNPNSRINVNDLEEGGQIFFISQDSAVGDISSAINRDQLISIENATGSEFDDEITGSAGDNVLLGLGGDDVIVGLQGVDTIDGGAGDDIIALIDTVDQGETISGGANGDEAGDSDTIILTSLLEGVTIDLDIANQGINLPGDPSQDGILTGSDSGNVTTLSDIENVVGTENDDTIFGNNEVNFLEGAGGDDLVHGFGSSDFLSGGEGTDTALFTAAPVGITVDLNDQVTDDEFEEIKNGTREAATFAAIVGAASNVLSGFENVTGSQSADTITGDEQDNTLTGNGGDDIIDGGIGNDILLGGLGSDTLTGGEGDDTFQGDADGLSGDTITDFLINDEIVLLNQVVETSDLAFDAATGNLTIDGVTDPLTLEGDVFDNGNFFAIEDEGNTIISFENDFGEAFSLSNTVAVAEENINGIVNQALLDGDGNVTFDVSILDLGLATFNNTLGVYEVDAAGNIVDTRILVNNTNAAIGETVNVSDVEAGNTLGLFIIQNGADFADGLAGGAVLSFLDGSGNAATTSSGPLTLAVDGVATDQVTFHSFDASLNSDGLEHVISGVDADSGQITVGFEDLTGLGDSDFEDVAFTIDAIDAVA